jgi:hypothetical protein
MLTYAGINLRTKKFQVGSTTDFERRLSQHMTRDMNPEFNRALQKNPSEFYWIVSEDDGFNDRSEEQYYLDFYCGSVWCYNINPNAAEPPSQRGKKWWTNGKEVKRSHESPGPEWKEGVSESMLTAALDNAQKSVAEKDETGKSIHARRMANESHRKRNQDGKSVRAVELGDKWKHKLLELYQDPDHPELGITTAGAIVRKQKARGLPSGPENRVKVQKEGNNG